MNADDTSLNRVLSLSPAERPAALATLFPDSTGPEGSAAHAAPLRGGRSVALEALDRIDPVAYARSRNHVGGAVTGLSPWIRHGVLSLAEVRDAALARVRRPEEAEKLVSELAWRDYWRQVHAALGDRMLDDIEPSAAVPRPPAAAATVPDDVLAAATGMRCIDAFVHRLHTTGRLHNHERMWLASWLVHVRRVRWRAGADWFLRHLLDGDPASNHLSWQWVAGTFSAKPYLFNRENLETYTAGEHCAGCPLLGRCDVEGTYEQLASRLFTAVPRERSPCRIAPAGAWRPSSTSSPPARPLVWLTLDAVAATSPAATAFPTAPTLFVIDPAWLAVERPTLKRLAFLFDCLADVPGVVIEQGDPAVVVPERARAAGCDAVVIAETPCPRVRASVGRIAEDMPVHVVDGPRFCDRSRVTDLGRFSRYWNRVRATALEPTVPSDR